MRFAVDKQNRSFVAEAFLSIIALWIGSYAYYQMFLAYQLKPLYSYFVIIAFTFFWMLYQRISNPAKLGAKDTGLKWIYVWVNLFIVWTLASYYYSTRSDIATETLIVAMESAALLACFVILVNHSVRVCQLSVVFAILALAGSAMCLWDFLQPTFSTVAGRGAGFYSNPTIASEVIALSMVAGFISIPVRLRWPYILFCGIGVLVTFSRASWLSWAVAVIGLTILGNAKGTRLRLLKILLITVLTSMMLLALLSGATEIIIKGLGLQQYMTIDTLNRLGIGDASLENFSANTRKDVALYSIEMIKQAPFLGYGIGYTNEWSMIETHNMYLRQWVEGGIIQMILYVGLLVMMWNMANGLGKIMVIQFILNSFFTHNNLEQPAMLLLFAFIMGTRLIIPVQSDEHDGKTTLSNL